jgi:glycosyltransferase involved in cell wall biosynthesis
VLLVGNPGSPYLEQARREGLPGFAMPLRGELNPAAVFRLARLLRRERPDIIHCHDSHAHTLGTLASRLAGAGRTVVSRRVDFSIHHAPLRLNILKYRFGVDRYIAISKGVREVLVRDGVPAEKIALVPSGVDIEALEATPRRDFHAEFGIPAAAPVVGNVAHFGWHKAQEILVRAAPLIWEREPEARVILVGDGECRPKVERVARELGNDPRLIFAGYRSDARALIRWFDLFVISSVLEGLCTSILDAHLLGTPVAATDTGGIPEIVIHEKTGLLAPPKNPRALAAAIIRLLQDRDLGRRLNVEAGRLVRARYSVGAMVDGTLNVYRNLLETAS